MIAADESVGQPDGRIDAHPDHREIRLGIERLLDDGADLDAAQPHVGADVQAVDAIEVGDHLIALHGADIGARDGEDHERDRDHEDEGADQRLNQISAHPGLLNPA